MSSSGEKKNQEDGDTTNIISALELKGLFDADNDDAVVEKDRYVAIGGPNADPKVKLYSIHSPSKQHIKTASDHTTRKQSFKKDGAGTLPRMCSL